MLSIKQGSLILRSTLNSSAPKRIQTKSDFKAHIAETEIPYLLSRSGILIGGARV